MEPAPDCFPDRSAVDSMDRDILGNSTSPKSEEEVERGEVRLGRGDGCGGLRPSC